MSKSKQISRRNVLRVAFATILGAATQSVLSANKRKTELTPAQTEGPFYPIQDQPDKDPDLTWLRVATRGPRVISS